MINKKVTVGANQETLTSPSESSSCSNHTESNNSSSNSESSRRRGKAQGKKMHKRKLAKQIIYERKEVVEPKITNEISQSLQNSIQTINNQIRLQNGISTFSYFPLYPPHVRNQLTFQVLNSNSHISNALPYMNFSAPVVLNYVDKSRDFQRACYLREGQQNSINFILDSAERMRTEFRYKLRPDPRLHPPRKPMFSLFYPNTAGKEKKRQFLTKHF